ncbi:MAG: 23S rRNA (guanosine(2251)-2'-O)-methyltransferase RlmB [Desulfarculus sp.]|nr:23S rRNA (guanosine(2251)-2'-O)-methyltransferase RlmB [Desulfarculus sp.]
MAAGEGSVVVGRHAVAQALEAAPQRAQELLLAAPSGGAALARILEMARAAGVKVRRVQRRDLDLLAGGAVHQGLGLRLAAAQYAPFEQVLLLARAAGPKALVLMADHIQDPHNLGALARSAAAAGAVALVVPKDRACPLTPAVAKAAAGALETLPLCRVTNLTNTLETLKEAGLWSLAAATQGHPAPWDLDLNLPLVLVVGGEHQGVGQRLLKACDLKASLPLSEGVESLNASVAAGVMLFEIVRQRRGATP